MVEGEQLVGFILLSFFPVAKAFLAALLVNGRSNVLRSSMLLRLFGLRTSNVACITLNLQNYAQLHFFTRFRMRHTLLVMYHRITIKRYIFLIVLHAFSMYHAITRITESRPTLHFDLHSMSFRLPNSMLSLFLPTGVLLYSVPLHNPS